MCRARWKNGNGHKISSAERGIIPIYKILYFFLTYKLDKCVFLQDSKDGKMPKEMHDLVDRKVLFKVQVKPGKIVTLGGHIQS